MKHRHWLLPGLFLYAAARLLAADGPPADLLGRAGDLEKLVITGIPEKDALQLREAFQKNMFIERAAAPRAAAYTLVDKLQRAAREAYLDAGYPSVSVDILRAGDVITLKVIPGSRYNWSAIQWNLPEGVDSKALSEALLNAPPSTLQEITLGDWDVSVALKTAMDLEAPADAVVQIGSPAAFDPEFQSQVRRDVAIALRKQGYTEAAIGVEPVIDKAAGAATLKISVTQLGPKATLDQLKIVGSKANASESVQKYLGIALGQPLDLARMQTMFDRLYASGRFSVHTLTLHPLSPGKAALTIELRDIVGVPSLEQKLSETEEALLRFRDWAATFTSQPDDLVISWNTPDLHTEVVVSPRDGGSCDMDLPPGGGANNHLGFLMARQAMGIQTAANRFLLPGKQVPAHVIMLIAVVPDVLSTDDEPHFNFSVAYGFTTASTVPPLDVRLNLAPAAFLAMAHKKSMAARVQGGLLTIDSGATRMTIDAATGRLKDIAAIPGGRGAAAQGKLVSGGLAREVEDYQRTPGPNAYDPRQPVGSFARFALAAAVRSPLLNQNMSADDRAAAAAVVDKLLTPETLAPLDQWSTWVLDGTLMTIPMTVEDRRMLAISDKNSWLAVFTPFVAPMFSYGSWPWTLMREATLAIDSDASAAEMRRLLEDPTLGPVGCLLAAQVCGESEREQALQFARMGEARMTPAAFSSDVAALVISDAPMPQFLRALFEHVRSLPAEDVKTLSKALPGNSAAAFIALHAALQLHKDEPIERALPAAAEALFPLVRPMLQSRLEAYAPIAPVLPDFSIAPP